MLFYFKTLPSETYNSLFCIFGFSIEIPNTLKNTSLTCTQFTEIMHFVCFCLFWHSQPIMRVVFILSKLRNLCEFPWSNTKLKVTMWFLFILTTFRSSSFKVLSGHCVSAETQNHALKKNCSVCSTMTSYLSWLWFWVDH